MENEENYDFIQKFNYKNSFWENTDILYKHSKNRIDEYLNIGNLSLKISTSINEFSEVLLESIKSVQFYEEEYVSTRNNAIKKVLNFIDKIVKNLKNFSQNLYGIAKLINDKIETYQSRKKCEKLCNENLLKYKDNLKKLNLRKEIYNDSVVSIIENFLSNKYKDSKTEIDLKPKLEYLNKKKQEYKEEVKNCEETRAEFIGVQRNILESEEEFDKECSEELKSYLNKALDYYTELLNSNKVDEEVINEIKKIDGNKDIQDFSEKNRDIMSFPPKINFTEYNQDMDIYYNFEVIKNKMKNLNSNEKKEFKKEISIEVNKFLEETVYKLDDKNDIINKYTQIANDILYKKLKKEDYEFIINEFQNKYSDFMEWKRTTIKDQEYLKVGKGWDNRFESMQIFLNIFNKMRIDNKKMEKENYDYFVKIMKKILEINNGDEVDYNLCNLLIILTSTFYYSEEIDGKEEKKYVSENIKQCKLFQKFEFWEGLVKNQLNEEIIKEQLKKEQTEQKNTFMNSINKNLTNLNININLNFRLSFSLLGKKKEPNKVDNVDKYNKMIMAKLMSVSYNLVQFVSSSDTLNKALYNIFRFYKLSLDNKKTIVEMLKFQIMSEGYNNLQIDEDLLINNKIDSHYKNNENEIKENEINNDNIKEDEEKELNEGENNKIEIMKELYNEEIQDDKINENEIMKDDKGENNIDNNVIKDENKNNS